MTIRVVRKDKPHIQRYEAEAGWWLWVCVHPASPTLFCGVDPVDAYANMVMTW